MYLYTHKKNHRTTVYQRRLLGIWTTLKWWETCAEMEHRWSPNMACLLGLIGIASSELIKNYWRLPSESNCSLCWCRLLKFFTPEKQSLLRLWIDLVAMIWNKRMAPHAFGHSMEVVRIPILMRDMSKWIEFMVPHVWKMSIAIWCHSEVGSIFTILVGVFQGWLSVHTSNKPHQPFPITADHNAPCLTDLKSLQVNHHYSPY